MVEYVIKRYDGKYLGSNTQGDTFYTKDLVDCWWFKNKRKAEMFLKRFGFEKQCKIVAVEVKEIQKQEQEAYKFDVQVSVKSDKEVIKEPIGTLSVFKNEVSTIELEVTENCKVCIDLLLKEKHTPLPN